MRIRFIAEDLGSGSLIEAAVDDVSISGFSCVVVTPPCPLDITDNNVVDSDDIFAFLNLWFAGPPGGTCTGCTADWDGNGSINSDDIFAYLNAWFAFGPGQPCP
jgi:hypothetical protein